MDEPLAKSAGMYQPVPKPAGMGEPLAKSTGMSEPAPKPIG
jgi:hypothetical protein